MREADRRRIVSHQGNQMQVCYSHTPREVCHEVWLRFRCHMKRRLGVGRQEEVAFNVGKGEVVEVDGVRR